MKIFDPPFKGVFYERELKRIPDRGLLRLSGLQRQYIDEKKIKHFIFTIESLPDNLLVDLRQNELGKYKFTPAAQRQIEKIKKF